MSHLKSRMPVLLTAAGVAVLLSISPLAAQPGGGPGGWGPGMMMGPGMMGRGGMWGGDMCNPRAAGLAQWRIASIERAVRPTDAQRPKLDELKTASGKAAEIITAACPRENSHLGGGASRACGKAAQCDARSGEDRPAEVRGLLFGPDERAAGTPQLVRPTPVGLAWLAMEPMSAAEPALWPLHILQPRARRLEHRKSGLPDLRTFDADLG